MRQGELCALNVSYSLLLGGTGSYPSCFMYAEGHVGFKDLQCANQ